MDFDAELDRIQETAKDMLMSVSYFQKVQSLIYQAYYLGKMESSLAASKATTEAVRETNLDVVSNSKQLAYHKHAETHPLFA